jgi:hypothetical protein
VMVIPGLLQRRTRKTLKGDRHSFGACGRLAFRHFGAHGQGTARPDFFPHIPLRWGLGHMINMEPGPNGRSARSLTWAGLLNTYYWIDPTKLPFS